MKSITLAILILSFFELSSVSAAEKSATQQTPPTIAERNSTTAAPANPDVVPDSSPLVEPIMEKGCSAEFKLRGCTGKKTELELHNCMHASELKNPGFFKVSDGCKKAMAQVDALRKKRQEEEKLKLEKLKKEAEVKQKDEKKSDKKDDKTAPVAAPAPVTPVQSPVPQPKK